MSSSKNLRDGIKSFSKLSDTDKLWVIDDIEQKLDSREYKNLVGFLTSALKNEIHQPYVFLSHSSKDKRFVRNLATHLENAGIKVWLDEVELKVGQSLIERLREAIDAVDFLIVILSKASVESVWVQKEIDIAMNQEIKTKKVKVLPILKEKVELPGFLEGKLYIDFSSPAARMASTRKLILHIHSYEISTIRKANSKLLKR